MNKDIVKLPNGQLAKPTLSLYPDGAIRLDLIDVFDGELLEVATQNCVAYCPPDAIIVKPEMAQPLFDAGVVVKELDRLPAERWSVEYPVLRLAPKWRRIVKLLREYEENPEE
jgi:hypothetical protein